MQNKLTTLRYFAETRWFKKFNSRKELQTFQEKMVIKHMAFLKDNSPFFAKLPLITNMDEFKQLPLMDKSVMMKDFNAMNTLGLDKDRALKIAIKSEKSRNFTPTYNSISVGLSSGTSGHRGLFLVSDKERSAWAGAVLGKYLPPGKPFGHRIAFFLRANNNLYETINSRFITFRYFDIYKDMSKNLNELASYQPSIIVAPPSVLSVIANQLETGELSIHPHKIISVAEVLNPRDELRFKKVFSQGIIFQAYQCTEGFLAHTCQQGSLHLNEDTVYVEKEFLDAKRFVPIITDFRRRSQPIIRYRLNDILVLSKKHCSCGSAMTAIERIEGREDDIFLFKNQAGETVQVFSDMIGRCMLYVKNIKDYRVVQTDYTKLVIHLDDINANTKQAIRHEITKLAQKLSFKTPELEFVAYELDLSRKLKRIERQFSK